MARSKILREFSLLDKVFAVTGAARGLGLVLAEALIESGAKVVALDRLPEKDQAVEFNIVSQKAKDLGSLLEYHKIDVTDVGLVQDTFADIAARHGRLDGLVAAAGIQQETPALDFEPNDFRRILDVNVVGVFTTAQAAAKTMIDSGKPGSIVLIASMSSVVANRDLLCCGYNASKAAVAQLARNLAAEWGQYNIRVNCISRKSRSERKLTLQLGTFTPRWWTRCSTHIRREKPNGPVRICSIGFPSPTSTEELQCS